MNGINNNGFITIGVPKIIGSLMLNSAGPKANLPNALYCSDLAQKSIKITIPNVNPDPVGVMKIAWLMFVNTCAPLSNDNSPAWFNALFSA